MGKAYPATIPHHTALNIRRAWKQPGSVRRRKCRLTPEEIFRRLQDPTTCRVHLAQEANITRQRMTQIIQYYLEDLVEGGHAQRTKLKKIKEQERVQRLREGLPNNQRLSRVVELARKRGLYIEPMLRKPRNKVLGIYCNRLLFNGMRVFICNLSNKQRLPKGKQEFSHTSLSPGLRRKIDIVIFHVTVAGHSERCFIVPAREALRLVYIAIPLRQREVYNNRPPKINFWEYLERWDLFEKR